ncbi:MAG: hypothetical protein HY744_08125, partial [Deltaproteobacteria bacterium]|nr:hypothetical protein [Deltaproteobacteria bacterium]
MDVKRAIEVGVVGLGQCGGNFAAEFAERGYPVLAINSSAADLRSTPRLDDDRKMDIGTEMWRGTGGSRSLGARCLEHGATRIKAKLAGMLRGREAAIAIGGLGGGTGGNLAALVEMIASKGFAVIALAVLPASSESYEVKVNALRALNELLDANFSSLVIVDNQKLYARFAGAGVDKFLREANAAVARAFDELNRLPGDEGLTSIRSFDASDLRQALLSGAVTVFGSRDVDEPLGRESLLQAFDGIVNDNELLASGFAQNEIVMVGSLIAANGQVLAETPATVFEEFFTEVKRAT